MTDNVTFCGALPSDVTGITVNVLPSGKASIGNPVTEVVPGGDV